MLDGWVRNRSDGSVEALVSGTTKAVEVFVGFATRGPAGAKVSAVDLHNSEPPPGVYTPPVALGAGAHKLAHHRYRTPAGPSTVAASPAIMPPT